MKRIILLLSVILVNNVLWADIAPNPIEVKGIYTLDNCKVQMVREHVFANLYNDSAYVECTFEMLNHGDSVTIEVGFPEMAFQYWGFGPYDVSDKMVFGIYVDDKLLSESEIKVPKEMESIYERFKYISFIESEYKRKRDSIYTANNAVMSKKGNMEFPSKGDYDASNQAFKELYKWRDNEPNFDSELYLEYDKQMKKGNFPWYVWDVHFGRDERKTIKVSYNLPSGMGYGANYRYFKYILETGAGWFGPIEQANINLQLHDIDIKKIEEVSPAGYQIDKTGKKVSWQLNNLEPTREDDIYVQYYNPKERREWNRYKLKRKLAGRFRFLNPVNWFR